MNQLQRLEQQSILLTHQLREGILLLDSVSQTQEQGIQIPMSKLMVMAIQEQEDYIQLQKRFAPRSRVAHLVLLNAEFEREVCPISMEPIRLETSCCVGPCYHVFQKVSIRTWLRTSTVCPVCRERCVL